MFSVASCYWLEVLVATVAAYLAGVGQESRRWRRRVFSAGTVHSPYRALTSTIFTAYVQR